MLTVAGVAVAAHHETGPWAIEEGLLCLVNTCAEPRHLANVGLLFDAIGAVLIAVTALWRLSIPGKAGMTMAGGMVYTAENKEEGPSLWWRWALVVIGGLLLVLGFGFQIYANHLQITAG